METTARRRLPTIVMIETTNDARPNTPRWASPKLHRPTHMHPQTHTSDTHIRHTNQTHKPDTQTRHKTDTQDGHTRRTHTDRTNTQRAHVIIYCYRISFACTIRMSFSVDDYFGIFLLFLAFLCLLTSKIIISIMLLSMAHEYILTDQQKKGEPYYRGPRK